MRRSVGGNIPGRDYCRRCKEHPIICECPKADLRDLIAAARLLVDNIDNLPRSAKKFLFSGSGWTAISVLAEMDPDNPEED